jgi:hypothetical protein
MTEASESQGASLTVVVHDEDAGGEPFEFHKGPGTPVSTVIAELYRDLKTDRKPGDRLTCLATGDDVFAHENEHLGQYAESACKDLEWGWAGQTGGA